MGFLKKKILNVCSWNLRTINRLIVTESYFLRLFVAESRTINMDSLNGVPGKVESFLHKRAQNKYRSIHRFFFLFYEQLHVVQEHGFLRWRGGNLLFLSRNPAEVFIIRFARWRLSDTSFSLSSLFLLSL